MIPRVTRRLVDSERKMITSGSVFVFDEDESGIKRWTDGFFWSPSRILGNFLLYRETEKRGAGHRGGTRNEPDHHQGGEPATSGDAAAAAAAAAAKSEGQTLSRPRGETTRLGIDRQRERSLVGSLTNSYKFKTGGMMKKVRFWFSRKSYLTLVRALPLCPARGPHYYTHTHTHAPFTPAKLFLWGHESGVRDVPSPSVTLVPSPVILFLT